MAVLSQTYAHSWTKFIRCSTVTSLPLPICSSAKVFYTLVLSFQMLNVSIVWYFYSVLFSIYMWIPEFGYVHKKKYIGCKIRFGCIGLLEVVNCCIGWLLSYCSEQPVGVTLTEQPECNWKMHIWSNMLLGGFMVLMSIRYTACVKWAMGLPIKPAEDSYLSHLN
jgi:hypothetical protein